MRKESPVRGVLEADPSPMWTVVSAHLEMALARGQEAEAEGATASLDSVEVVMQVALAGECRTWTIREMEIDAE
jgi:hypothetical protein